MLSVPVILTTRQWMKAAKAWRCYLELPADSIVAIQLTAYIESKMRVTLQADDGSQVEISPAFIVDVPNKGKKFTLVIETVYEKQAEIGPYLTGMIGERIIAVIAPEDAPPLLEKENPRGDISEKILKGLHINWFKNQKFWSFLGSMTGGCPIDSEQSCKAVFKQYMGIESCTELTNESFRTVLAAFNQYAAQK